MAKKKKPITSKVTIEDFGSGRLIDDEYVERHDGKPAKKNSAKTVPKPSDKSNIAKSAPKKSKLTTVKNKDRFEAVRKVFGPITADIFAKAKPSSTIKSAFSSSYPSNGLEENAFLREVVELKLFDDRTKVRSFADLSVAELKASIKEKQKK